MPLTRMIRITKNIQIHSLEPYTASKHVRKLECKITIPRAIYIAGLVLQRHRIFQHNALTIRRGAIKDGCISCKHYEVTKRKSQPNKLSNYTGKAKVFQFYCSEKRPC